MCCLHTKHGHRTLPIGHQMLFSLNLSTLFSRIEFRCHAHATAFVFSLSLDSIHWATALHSSKWWFPIEIVFVWFISLCNIEWLCLNDMLDFRLKMRFQSSINCRLIATSRRSKSDIEEKREWENTNQTFVLCTMTKSRWSETKHAERQQLKRCLALAMAIAW